MQNHLTGEDQTVILKYPVLSSNQSLKIAMNTQHCGWIECQVAHLRISDYLGLFRLPLRSPAPTKVQITPLPTEAYPLPALESGRHSRTAHTSVPDENYDPRPYRTGDSLRSIHWKLSAKRDQLIVREPLSAQYPTLILFCNAPSSPDLLDRALDLLQSTSQLLLKRGWPHLIQWGTATFPVSCQRELGHALATILQTPPIPTQYIPVEGTVFIPISADLEEAL